MHTLIPNASVLSKHLTTLAAACGATEVVLFERTTFLVIATSIPPTPSTSALSAGTITPSSSHVPATSPLQVSTPSSPAKSVGASSHGNTDSGVAESSDNDPHRMESTRYERTSELIKAFKHTCSRMREEFHALEMELPEFTAVLDELTKNTYVLIVVHDPTIGMLPHLVYGSSKLTLIIETAALRLNIRLARKKFEELQSDSLSS